MQCVSLRSANGGGECIGNGRRACNGENVGQVVSTKRAEEGEMAQVVEGRLSLNVSAEAGVGLNDRRDGGRFIAC